MTGDGKTEGRKDGRSRRWYSAPWLVVSLLSVFPSFRLSAQTDTLRATALRIAQTRPDSARAMMRRLLARLAPQDSLYPGALFTAGLLASDAGTVATNMQRVVIEYGRSVWADSALLVLAQLYYAQGDPAATVQATERLRQDYPDSPLRARAAFTGARGYIELKDDGHACPLIQEALDHAGGDVEFKNQAEFYAARCTAGSSAAPAGGTGAAGAGGAAGAPSDSQARAAATVASYAVQVLAVKSAAQVDDMLTRLKVMGFDARVVRDTSGLFKVRVGRYPTRDEAAKAQRRLKTRLGGQPFVVEEP